MDRLYDISKGSNCACSLPGLGTPRRWSQLAYAGETRVPAPDEPLAGSWPTYFFTRDEAGNFYGPDGNPVAFRIRQPDIGIDFEGEQLCIVKRTLANITQDQITIAKYWGDGPPTKQFTPIIDRLIDTYNVSAPRAARILGAVQAAINDVFVVVWYLKYRWDIARPNQLDRNLATVLCTPKHPSYPSGHATSAGCMQVVLSYFFQTEAARLKQLADECAMSRLYAGVHFPVDNEQGLSLGRHIGEIIIEELDRQRNGDSARVDIPMDQAKNAAMQPPPYTQAIPYNRDGKCTSLILNV
jgi:Membrane-associated phospholipid phosphatase